MATADAPLAMSRTWRRGVARPPSVPAGRLRRPVLLPTVLLSYRPSPQGDSLVSTGPQACPGRARAAERRAADQGHSLGRCHSVPGQGGGSGRDTLGEAMSTQTNRVTSREPELLGQIVVLLGGSAGIGLETARLARAAGADVVLTGRDPDRLHKAADDVGALASAAFDATDTGRLDRFFQDLPQPIDHVLLTGGGPYYAPLADMDFARARRDVDEHLWVPLHVARAASGKVQPGGTLLFVGGTGGRRRGIGLTLIGALTAAMPALVANLALEIAPVRVNLIAAGFVDTPLSARLLGDALEARREELRATLPVRRVVQPADVAALAVHLMANTALTGATYDVDGGQQLV